MNILSRDLRMYIGESKTFIVAVLSDDEKVARNVRVNVILKNRGGDTKLYELTSDNDGLVKLSLGLSYIGVYTLTTYYKSDEVVNKLVVTDSNNPNIVGQNPLGYSFSKAEMNNATIFIQSCIKNGFLPDKVQMASREDGEVYEITKPYYAGLFEAQNLYWSNSSHLFQPNYVTLNSIAYSPNVSLSQPNDWTCGSTSAAMAVQSCYGYLTEKQCRENCGTIEGAGTSPSGLISGMAKLGYIVTPISRNFDIVKSKLEKGNGIIIHYQTAGNTKPSCMGFVNDYGHYMCCYKAENGKYYLFDPSKGSKICDASQIDNATNGRNIYYYAVVPK